MDCVATVLVGLGVMPLGLAMMAYLAARVPLVAVLRGEALGRGGGAYSGRTSAFAVLRFRRGDHRRRPARVAVL